MKIQLPLKNGKNPIGWFIAIIGFVSLLSVLQKDNLNEIVRSDGSGYYAYLPALFIYNDGGFDSVLQVEKSYHPNSNDQLYLYQTQSGKKYTKYFPGVAILQLPFFGLACLISTIFNAPVDGYSSIFMFCFYLGSLFYSLTGVYLFYRFLSLLFPKSVKQIQWLVPVFYISTTLFFYGFKTPSFGHLYSFFLFGCFGILSYKIKTEITKQRMLLFGIILGLIVLIRPTNLLVIMILPFILSDFKTLRSFLKTVFLTSKIYFLVAFIGCFLVLLVLFFVWKWQTGQWVIWSYSGEGFTFFQPKFFQSLVSFRNGLFLHSPILLLSIIGIILHFKKNSFQATAWIFYFVVNFWVITSWWCWDYESPFGNRPLTEHLFFLLIPILYFTEQISRIWCAFIFSILSVIGVIRTWEITSGFMGDQRFTKENYFSSLQFWKSENSGRWNFTKSCHPFGEKINAILLINEQRVTTIDANNEYAFGSETKLEKPRTNERYFVRLKLEKLHKESSFNDVFLVIDASNSQGTERYYRAIPLYSDKLDGTGKWVLDEFESHIYDNFQRMDTVKIYIWNPGKKTFDVKNIQLFLEEYKS
jgi:hypothetical protein